MRIDVWYDVVCPWCWLGKARLDRAIADEAGAKGAIEVVTHSFELDPRSPKDLDIPSSEMVAKKYGIGSAQLDAMHERMSAMGREVGIEYRFERVRTANTFDAHQLVHHARSAGGEKAANDMADRLFVANFHDGLRVGSRDVLVKLAKDAGLDESEAAAALEGQRYADEVRADERQAAEIGITGVPFFLFEGKLAVSGAQSIDVLRSAMARAR